MIEFVALHESLCGPERRLLRDSNTSEIGGRADVKQTSSIGRRPGTDVVTIWSKDKSFLVANGGQKRCQGDIKMANDAGGFEGKMGFAP